MAHHHAHSWAIQSLAFYLSLVPAVILLAVVIFVGALERMRRPP